MPRATTPSSHDEPIVQTRFQPRLALKVGIYLACRRQSAFSHSLGGERDFKPRHHRKG